MIIFLGGSGYVGQAFSNFLLSRNFPFIRVSRQSLLGQKLIATGKQFEFFEREGEFLSLAALTPRSNCVLDTQKLSRGIVMTPVAEAIERALLAWKER